MNLKPLLISCLSATTPLATSYANPTNSEGKNNTTALLCNNFTISGCNGEICLSNKIGKLTTAVARDIKLSSTRKLEDVGIFDFDDLVEESATRPTRKPDSGKVILDSFGWPHPLDSENLGSISMLSAADLPCTDESSGQRDKTCYVTVARMGDGISRSRALYISSITSNGGKMLLTTDQARSAARCATAYRFFKRD
jgi:hypothetical protein